MQFKHPEVLYALLLLIIPILIHLFQLRRFQKVKFTNVKLLKQIDLQTRKSSQLKRWLVLLTRLLAIGLMVLAFAQPFTPKTEDYNVAQETVIYLDNSFSMQAEGKNGSLLNEAIQKLLTSFPDDDKLSVFTNDKVFKNTTLKAIKNDLIRLPYSNEQLNYRAAYLKGKELFSDNRSFTKNLIFVSDFQRQGQDFAFSNDSLINFRLVQQLPNTKQNVSIDSVYIKTRNAETLEIAAVLKAYGNPIDDVSVSLFNKETLLAKNATEFKNNRSEVLFTIPNNMVIDGTISVEDRGLNYDNTFYFNINEKPKIKVLSINNQNDAKFLSRIYTEDEFEFLSYNIDELNFNLIPNQNLVVLNELERISDALLSALSALAKDGGSITVIPHSNAHLTSYNKLLKSLTGNSFETAEQRTTKITQINFDHPLLANTFYSKVTNFQYPKTEQSFGLSKAFNAVLRFEDNKPFLTGSNHVYIFTAPLNSSNSNFINSQLVVPIFYNMGLQSLPLAKLYYPIGSENTIAINTSLGQDEILSLESSTASIIPLQKTFKNMVTLQMVEFPKEAGILQVKNKDTALQNLSFNYPREESNLSYINVKNIADGTLDKSLDLAIETIKSNANVNALWKWFVIFALVFLLIELLLLKYLK